MDKKTILLFLFPVLSLNIFFSQEDKDDLPETLSALFQDDKIVQISLRYSNKDIKKVTNDSTFITTHLKYEAEDAGWDSLEVRLRKRGNFRLKNCYYAPIKVKIKKKAARNTLFEDHKNLKLVLPCLLEKGKNDNVIKEYIAYKLYELVSPYHFKTRLVEVNLEEIKGKGIKNHKLKGFLVEDDKHVAKRIGGKVLPSKTHPLNQMPLECVRNSFFHFMIGNTDYSIAYQHNSKLIFLEGQIIPVPYDFDMAGLVNTSYATVSQINDQRLDIDDVRIRKYRGFQRDPHLFTEVRLEFLAKRQDILTEIEKCKPYFENDRSYRTTVTYIDEFFKILVNDKRFEDNILRVARAY